MGARPRYDLLDLGTLGGPKSAAVALNDHGVVVGAADTDLTREGEVVRHAFLWENGRLHDLGDFTAADINNDNVVVGRRYHGSHLRAVRLDGRGLTFLQPPSYPASCAKAIDDRGQIAGWLRTPAKRADMGWAFVWQESSLSLLRSDESDMSGEATSLNNQGHAAGYVTRAHPQCKDAFLKTAAAWRDGKAELISPPAGFHESSAVAINDAGQVLCRAACDRTAEWLQYQHFDIQRDVRGRVIDWTFTPAPTPFDDGPFFFQSGFLGENGEAHLLDTSTDGPFRLNIPRAMNQQGQVVGTTGCDGITLREPPRAFLYDGRQMTDLNDLITPETGWTLLDARDINNVGQIVGRGRCQGAVRAFRLDPRGL